MRILLCKPNHFRVDYRINPWMKIGSVNQSRALRQWNSLVSTYQNAGVQVNIIDQHPDFPDMVFAADQVVPISATKLLISRFRHSQRQGESDLYRHWFQQHGFATQTLPENCYFEGGGELQHFGDHIIIGTGFRTDPKSARTIAKLLNKKSVLLELIDDRFYHLDTCLFVLSSDVIFYYPQAFSQASINLLKSLTPKLYEIQTNEALNFAANAVVFDSTVFIQSGNPIMSRQISKLGYGVEEVNVSEFHKAGGGPHCLTGMLVTN